MTTRFPTPLRSGQTIGIFSPSSAIARDRFEAGVALLKARGYHVLIHPQTYTGCDTGNQIAGSAADKVAAFMDLWTNPDVDAVFASCGGNFACHMLPLLPWDVIAKTPKILMGFSDTTALLTALYARTGISGVFGPTVQTLARIQGLDKVFDIIEGRTSSAISLAPAQVVREGQATAPVFAATLSLLNLLSGTSYFPDLTGHILLVEDIGEELNALDRMLWKLNEVCPFTRLAGLVFGEFVDLKDTGRPLGLGFEDIITSHTRALDIPVLMQAPFGHGDHLFPVPLGKTASFDTGAPDLIFI